MELCLFKPEIPQNAGTLARMCSCFGITMSIIEPASFILDNRLFKRAGMDYISCADIKSYNSFEELRVKKERIILLDIKAKTTYYDFKFQKNDCIMIGRESDGVPDDVFEMCNEKLIIPMISGRRSLNAAISAAIVISEALRQTKMLDAKEQLMYNASASS